MISATFGIASTAALKKIFSSSAGAMTSSTCIPLRGWESPDQLVNFTANYAARHCYRNQVDITDLPKYSVRLFQPGKRQALEGGAQ